jgi:ABC-type multidrug transport system fused ATPase/permease subunit
VLHPAALTHSPALTAAPHPYARLWRAILPRRRAQLSALLAFTLLASLAEVFSIGAVLPFLGVLTAPEKVYTHEFAQPLIQALALSQPQDLLMPVTVLFCAAALLAAVVRVLSIWLRTRLTFATGADLSNEIYRRTLHQPYAVHLARNSSEVIDGISGKVSNVINGVLSPLIVIASNSLMLSVILGALLLYQPVIAMVAFGGFGLIYGAIYQLARARLRANSKEVAACSTQRIKSLQEGLGGIRDVLLDNTQEVYCAAYRQADRQMRRAQAEISITGEVPRFAIEALGICLIAALAYQLAQRPGGFQTALPLIGALAVAAQRLLPLLQQLYFAFTNLSGSEQSLLDTLTLLEQPLPAPPQNASSGSLPFHSDITCQGLGFKYREDGPWVLRDLNLHIPKGGRLGFIGTTGSGKSTLLDVVMGLLLPTEGALTVDGQAITAANSRHWQARIAHVPQAIYLSDASIAENIAFGVPPGRIDMARVRRAAAQAQMATTIEGWAAGYQTLVGERGVRLSGGQRQRIGIARALYKQADVLVLDEATSALDSETERSVMQAIEALGRELTILIVAHRITTLRGCNQVVELSHGQVVRSGPYDAILFREADIQPQPAVHARCTTS